MSALGDALVHLEAKLRALEGVQRAMSALGDALVHDGCRRAA
jgi:hypothetical protein